MRGGLVEQGDCCINVALIDQLEGRSCLASTPGEVRAGSKCAHGKREQYDDGDAAAGDNTEAQPTPFLRIEPNGRQRKPTHHDEHSNSGTDAECPE